MIESGDYPFLKVAIWMSLSPSIGGTAFGLYMWFFGALVGKDGDFLYLIPVIGLCMLGGVCFFFVPALFVSVVCVLLKLRGGWRSWFFLFICGGLMAWVWCRMTFNMMPYVIFFLGSISAVVMSYFVLPKKLDKVS